MLHLGDITKISGYTAPIVDCVVGGSPCQDLSVAGKRAGLDGERSGLFMDQVRIVKEMRERDVRDNGRSGVDVRPRYLVWENVPGAFSSNKGEDFRIVLEEIARVKDKDAVIPRPDKWQTSGCILGDGWSIAWRVLDAQFWGVPQRRRRIALVADFGGHSAPEILFVSEGVCGYSQPSKPKGQAVTQDASRCTGADDCEPKLMDAYQHHGYRESDTCGTLTAGQNDSIRGDTPLAIHSLGADQYNAVILGDSVSTLGVNCGMSHGRQCVLEPVVYENHSQDSRYKAFKGVCETVSAKYGTGGNNQPLIVEPTVFSKSKRAQTPTDYETWQESDTANTLNTFDQGDVRTNECVIALDRASYNQGQNAQFDFDINDGGSDSTIVAKGPSAVCYTVDQGAGESACSVTEGQAPTLACTHDGAPAVCYSLDPLSSNSMKSSNPHSGCHETNVARTIDTTYPDPSKNQGGVAVVNTYQSVTGPLMANSHPGSYTGQDAYNDMLIASVDCRNGTEDEVNGALQSIASNNINSNNVVRTRYTVRRLTPLECERLQGLPDGWTDIGDWTDSKGKKRKTSDANRYKALGNSIALPPWKFVMKRLCACYERDATLASLFDGISVFPLIWTQLNGWGSVLWSSENDEFPMAVCKKHFGDEETGEQGDLYQYLQK